MKIDWAHITNLPWAPALRSRLPLITGALGLWAAGLALALQAQQGQAQEHGALLQHLTSTQERTQAEQAAQGQSSIFAEPQVTRVRHRFAHVGPATKTDVQLPGMEHSRVAMGGAVEVAQAGPVSKDMLKDLLAATPKAQPHEPASEPQPQAAEPVATPEPTADPGALADVDLPAATPQNAPATLELTQDGTETTALPQVPSVDAELAGIAGGAAPAPPAAGDLAAMAAAAVVEPTDAIENLDERRIARETFELASKHFGEGKWQEAKAAYEKVLEFLPKHPAALVNLGLVEERLGNDEAAKAMLERALTENPDAQPALMSLGLLYSKAGELTKAMSRMTRLVELNPRDAMARNHLGVVLAQRGWREAAESEFRAAVEMNPLYQQGHFNLALMYLERNPPAVELARRHYNTSKQLGASPDKEVEAMLASSISMLPGERPVLAP